MTLDICDVTLNDPLCTGMHDSVKMGNAGSGKEGNGREGKREQNENKKLTCYICMNIYVYIYI